MAGTAASPREPPAGGSASEPPREFTRLRHDPRNFSRRRDLPQVVSSQALSEQPATGFSGPLPPLQSPTGQGSHGGGQQRRPAPSGTQPLSMDTQSSGPQPLVSPLTTQERQSRVTRSPVSAFPPEGSYNPYARGPPPPGNNNPSSASPSRRHW